MQIVWRANWFDAARGEVARQDRLACRPATVARWVYDNLRTPDTPFCGAGHSNGASQFAYMLSRYGLADLFSLVLLESGPNWARLDRGCLWNDPRARPLWMHHTERADVDWAFGVFEGRVGPCAQQRAELRAAFEQASLELGGWEFFYPHTLVWFVFGGLDMTPTAAQGRLFHDRLEQALTPFLRTDTVADAFHFTTDTPEAEELIRDIFLDECVAR